MARIEHGFFLASVLKIVNALEIKNRFAGSLFAGAVGDAIGSNFEGKPPDSPFVLPTNLFVTDDTQLTLATCEAITDSQTVDPESIAASFARWYRERRISGIGSSTLKALIELEAGGHWALVGATGERSAGNGAAMRIAPLAFVSDPDQDNDRQTIRDVCRITHRNEEAYIGAIAILRAIRFALAGGRIDSDLLPVLIDSLPDSRVRERLIELNKHDFSVAKYARHFSASGYVVDSVPLAILAFAKSSDLLTSIAEIVQCGGDTDTTASMFGQLVGAAYGTDCLPTEFIERIDMHEQIQQVVSDFPFAICK